MRLNQLTAEERRIALDAAQLYEQFLDVREERQAYRGGLHWKKVGGKDYLVKTLDRHGTQQSLGARSRASEQTYRNFTQRKRDLSSRLKALQEELRRQARFCVAGSVNRVPRLAADIVRLLDTNGLLGTPLIVVGSHALYAYEMAAGVQLRAGLLQTVDLDALLEAGRVLNLGGPIRRLGLIGILCKVDKTFKMAAHRSFRAVNARGFAVELIGAHSETATGPFSIGLGRDLIAELLPGLQWLSVPPTMSQIVIGENGYPVRFVVPDPRVFALHKLWLSLQPTRSPLKRKRDFRQGEAVAQLALDYLNLSFDDAALKALPAELTSMVPGLVDRLRSRTAGGSKRFKLPIGFEEDRDI